MTTSNRDERCPQCDGPRQVDGRCAHGCDDVAPARVPAAPLTVTISRDALMRYVEWHGGIHDDGCPGDDTCDCSWKPVNDALNEALRAAAPPRQKVHEPGCPAIADDESDYEHLADAGECCCSAQNAALALALRERDRLQAQITNGGCVDHRDYLDACEERDQFQRTVAQLRAVCVELDAFQRTYETNTYDSMPGNEHYSGLLLKIVQHARAALAAGDAPEDKP